MVEKLEDCEHVKLGGTWKIIHHPGLIATTKVIKNEKGLPLLITEKEKIVTITVAWKPKKNEVNFYFIPKKNVIIINRETFNYVECFPFLLKNLSKDKMTVDCCLTETLTLRTYNKN